MIYVFDSNALIVLFNHFYRKLFPSLWEKFDLSVKEGNIVSVREVFNEIERYGDRLSEWAKKNRNFFHQPSTEELVFVGGIFKVSHFQYLVGKKQRLGGKPVADPFVIAKAKALNNRKIARTKAHIPRIPLAVSLDVSLSLGNLPRY